MDHKARDSRKILTTLCFVLIFMPYLTMARETGWLGVFSRKENASLQHATHLEAQMRYDLKSGRTQQSLIRFGVLYQPRPKHEVGWLLGFIETGSLVEHRPTFHHQYFFRQDEIALSLRSRLEWREWEGTSESSLRSRLLLNFTKKINSQSSWTLFLEPFFNLTRDKMSGERIFERNRLFLGLRRSSMGHLFDIGYMNQHIPREKTINEHILLFYVHF